MGRVFGLALIAVFFVAGCGDDPDDWEEGRPLIRKLTYLQQMPDKPFQLTFSVEFEDTDGDLAAGIVRLYSNDREQDQLELRDLFTAGGIAEDAVLGELEVPVTIASDLQDGERVKLGFVLQDAAGNKSNDPSVVLQTLAPGG